MINYYCEWGMESGHESVWVEVWAEDCVGTSWFLWWDGDCVGAINSVMITQDWARVDQQLLQGVMGHNKTPQ